MAAQTIDLWPETCPHHVQTDYGAPRLDVYPPAGQTDKPRAAVIVCPGGGYGMLAPHEGAPLAELFAAHGMVGFVCYYRVAPHRFPLPQADVMRAVRLVRARAEEFSVDPQRIGLMGFSAGGHNAATVATQPNIHKDAHDDLVGRYDCRPNRLILGYPVISFLDHAHRGCIDNLMGEDASDDQCRALSNQLHVTAENPPTFTFHTADDGAVPVENSLMFAGALRRAGVPCESHVYESGPHGVGMALDNPKLRSWTAVLIDWLHDWHG